MNQNFTSIDHLLEPQLQVAAGFAGPEKIEIAVSTPKEEYKIHEVVEHTGPKEVKGYIEARPETVRIPKELKKIGVVSVVNPIFKNYKPVVLPLSDQSIEQGLHAPITSSFRWLAELCLYILKQAHLTLKKVHGRLVRVVFK